MKALFLSTAVLAAMSSIATAQTRVVAPVVGPWDYGENRCVISQYGYSDEDKAAIGGAKRHYLSTSRCEWSYEPKRGWGTKENPEYGPCGSTNLYPLWTLGVESVNTRQYKITYRYGDNCQYGPTNDGITVSRVRPVACPAGYVNSSNRCILPPDAIDPNKNNDGCPAGGNGSNPIHSALGTKLQREPDFDFGLGLAFERHYSSASHWGATSVGQHWRHGFDATVRIADATYANSVVTAWVQRPNGNLYSFNRVSDSEWVPEADVALKLKPVLSGGQVSGWNLQLENGNFEYYDGDGRLIGIESPESGLLVLNYVDGLLDTISDRLGRSIKFAYDTTKRIKEILGPDGGRYGYVYDDTGRLQSVSFPVLPGSAPVSRTYFYEDTRFPYALTGIVDESGRRYASWSYDPSGRAIVSVHGDINGLIDRTTLNYGSNATTVVDSLGKSRSFTFSQSYGVKRVAGVSELCTTCGGSSNNKTYDANGRLDLATDFKGVVTDYDYDANGLLKQKIESSNKPETRRTVLTDWDAALRKPAKQRTYDASSALVAEGEWGYNSRGQVLRLAQRDPLTNESRTSTYTYCEQSGIDSGSCPVLGLITSIDGPRTDVNDITTYTYRAADAPGCATAPATCAYRKGDLWKVANGLGQITETLRYDGAGRVLSTKDANGIVTDREYSPRGWLAFTKVRGANNSSESDDAITRFDYQPTGLVERITQADGSFTRFEYDAAHRLTDVLDNLGNRIHYTLDNAGNRTREDTQDSNGTLLRKLSRVYNQLGQLERVKDAYDRATTYTYDLNGNADTTTDALTRVADSDHDPLNRLVKSLQDTAGIKAATDFKYNALDQLTQVTDPKRLNTFYGYNALGDLKQLTSPDTGISTYTYDTAGNRKTAKDARGEESTYAYDVLNRLTGITYASDASLNVGYTYDTAQPVCESGETFAVGRLSKMTDGSGQTQYCYDRFGNLTRKVQTSAGKALTVRYGYSLAGRLLSMTYPSGMRVDYVRNSLGQPTGVKVTPAGGTTQVLVSNVTYYPFGPVAEIEYGDGRRLKRTHNLNYQPGVIEDQGPDGLSLGYEFDEVGNLKTLRNGTQSEPPLRKYHYDGLNRLDEVKDGATDTVLQAYSYDATGNRMSATDNGVATPYTYDAASHRLSKVGAVARTYDAMGNTQTIGGAAQSFVYNAAGRMAHAKRNGAVVQSYLYNGRGEQVRRYVGTASTSVHAAYDEAGQWLGGYDVNVVRQQEVIWLDDMPVGVIASSGALNDKLYYVQPDHLGSPRVVIDPSREKAIWVWSLTGEVFGNDVPDQDVDRDGIVFGFDLRFPGQRSDVVSGLNYNYFRDYEFATGRYVESDPIGLKGGAATYAYVSGRPTLNTDPVGLMDVYSPIFCAMYPTLCNELMACRANPSACKAKFCRAGNALYHPMCDNGACSESNSCLTINFKEILSAGCYTNRLMVKYFCYGGKSDDGHDEQLQWAKLRWRGCLNLQEQRGCKNCQ